jgi:hypothetical protein
MKAVMKNGGDTGHAMNKNPSWQWGMEGKSKDYLEGWTWSEWRRFNGDLYAHRETIASLKVLQWDLRRLRETP